MKKCGLRISKWLEPERQSQVKAEQPASLVVCLLEHQEALIDQKLLATVWHSGEMPLFK